MFVVFYRQGYWRTLGIPGNNPKFGPSTVTPEKTHPSIVRCQNIGVRYPSSIYHDDVINWNIFRVTGPL